MKVEVYGKAWCMYCERAKDLLTENGLEYEYKDVEDSAQSMAEMSLRAPGARTVPQIFIDDSLVGGYDQLRAWFKSRSA